VNKQARQNTTLVRPLANSYWVIPALLLAGEHPAGAEAAQLPTRLQQLLRAGIDSYIDLTEVGEQPEYRHLLPGHVEYLRCGIADTCVPNNVSQTREVLAAIHSALARGRRVYVHCRAGIGRTGLIVGCFLAEEDRNGGRAIKRLNALWRQSARAVSWPKVPQTAEQADYIRRWPKLRTLGS